MNIRNVHFVWNVVLIKFMRIWSFLLCVIVSVFIMISTCVTCAMFVISHMIS